MNAVYEKFESILDLPYTVSVLSAEDSKLHWHRTLTFIFVLSGKIELHLYSDKMELNQGDLMLINPGDMHCLRKVGNTENEVLKLQANPIYFNKFVGNFSDLTFRCIPSEIKGSTKEKYDRLRHLLAKFVYDLSGKTKGYSLRISALMLEMMEMLYLHFVETSEDKCNRLRGDSIKTLRMALNKIDKEFDRGMTLSSLADDLELNMHYLSRLIKKSLGITFQEYIDSKRLQRAIELLTQSDKTVTEVALESGFPNVKSMNRLIKAKYELTSRELRKKKGELNDQLVGVQFRLGEAEIEDKAKLQDKLFKHLFKYLDASYQ
ncbi:MAG: AraC family transcriptional regulator [Gudongella sp.]|jgi:xylan 1,4-beta-xylosidase|nr:AraC family transcriptional regulator [Gudongella sp.]